MITRFAPVGFPAAAVSAPPPTPPAPRKSIRGRLKKPAVRLHPRKRGNTMNRKHIRPIAILLTVLMVFQLSDGLLASAAEDPTAGIALSVPESLQDGGDYFFIREDSFTISETSGDRLYIPIQRTGNTEQSADVTLKLIDMSARYGKNYKAWIRGDRLTDPELVYDGMPVIDLFLNADEIIEEPEPDESELGEILYENGGAAFLDANGETIGTIKATPVDENGDPVPEEPAPAAEEATFPAPAAEESASPARALMAARSAYTGTVSDRQKLDGGDSFFGDPEEAVAAQKQRELTDDDVLEDSYPGREYAVHFDAGETVRFLVVDPMDSEAADGDAMIMLMLKGFPAGAGAPEDFNMRSVIITDEDEREPVVFSMAADTVTAADGRAVINVTRSGRVNDLVGVMLSSQDGTAAAGKDYGGVGAKLWFPMGVTERSVELPVGQDARDKEFTVTISPLSTMPEVEIAQASTRVVIPRAEAEDDALLFDDSDKYGEPWDLLDRKYCMSNYVNITNDDHTGLFIHTPSHKLGTYYIDLDADHGYAWDGLVINFKPWTWYAKIEVGVDKYVYNEDWSELYKEDFGDAGEKAAYRDQEVYYGSLEGPAKVRIKDYFHEWHNLLRNGHADLFVDHVQSIKRNFTVRLINNAPLAFEGMSGTQVLQEYQRVMLNDTLETVKTFKTLDNFSVSQVGAKTWAKFVGLEAVKSDGSTYRIATLDGKSGTAMVELSEYLIDRLGYGGYISWTKSGDSYAGSINVRPVFAYVSDVTVVVRDNPYGKLVCNGRTLSAGTHTFHYGDRLTFVPNVDPTWDAAMNAVGVGYESRKGSAAGPLAGKIDCMYYTDEGVTFTLTDDYYEFWQVFSDVDNMVQVQVPKTQLQYFDTDKGLFAGLTPTEAGSYQVYQVRPKVLTNEFVELTALAKDGTHVPVWTLGNKYSGSSFCFFAGVEAADNLITLTMDTNAAQHADYVLSGMTYTSTYNLSTGRMADDMFPAEDAVITSALSGAVSDEEGAFNSSPMYLLGGSLLRYAVTYNGTTAINEVRLPDADSPTVTVSRAQPDGSFADVAAIPVTLGNIQVSGWNRTGAHFSDVTVDLSGFDGSLIHAVEMNGKTLNVNVTVDTGNPYIHDGAEYTENVTEVMLYFQNQITGDIHGIYSTAPVGNQGQLKWNAVTNTATLEIKQFSPDNPEDYTWGDVIMVSLSTDRRGPGDRKGMTYQPASTGYAVMSDQEYVPATFDYDMDIETLLTEGLADDEPNTRYSFGKFPWLGSITAVLRTFSYFTSKSPYNEAQMILEDLDDMGGDELELMEDGADASLMEGVGGVARRWALSAAVAFKETPYGGVRTMIAVAGSFGNSQYSKMSNPYRTRSELKDYLYFGQNPVGGDLIYGGNGTDAKTQNKFVQSELGGGYIYFTVYVGLYIDWGYFEKTVTDGSGRTEVSHEACFLGAGGFLGCKLTGGYTQYVFIPCPVYFNIEANLGVTLFLGSSADPNKTLQSFYETKDHKGQDFHFELEVQGDAGLRLTIGLGYYKLFGVRATGGLGVQLGYSLRMKDWFPGLTGADTLSVSTDATFSGSVDLIVTSIDLWSASWPLPLGYGWLQYFQHARRANTLIHFINNGINEKRGSEAARAKCRAMADELAEYVDAYQGSGAALKRKVDELREYADDTDVITNLESMRVRMMRQGGIAGNIADSIYLTDDENDVRYFHTRDHVDTRWVAGEDAALMSAFGPVSSSKLVENAVSQPAGQIAPIGDNRFLVVFADDAPDRDRQQASVLKYTVYDAGTDKWTAPQAIQKDHTADGRANLIDAGDKLVLSWASVTDEKLEALKSAVAAELGTDSADIVRAALEADPARVMSQMDIFTVQFDKHTGTFGPIEQLTDDEYYDDSPMAVYDEETGDYVVYYYKTAQDSEAYDSAEERLSDLVSSNTDPDRTYCVMCYMLYNNQTAAPDADGVTHAPGWAKDYLFDNEFDPAALGTKADRDDYLAQWGGQRFLSSTIRTDAGEQTDAPIADLTVCNGYNGLAAYAFTVDTDFNTETGEDRDLYVQFYRFSDHKTYVPVKVAGETMKSTINKPVRQPNPNVSGAYETVTPASVTEARTEVNVGQPRLIRSGGSTWLFWREDEDGLRYLNISEMLNAKVPAVPEPTADEADWTYALQSDGTFAVDPNTGVTYEPYAQRVDFGSRMTSRDMDITDYQVITDADDNLYVVWTDINTFEEEGQTLDETLTSTAQAIYATAMIKHPDSDAGAGTAAWSKPYRLTRDNSSNDGVAIALDDNGGLLILHNQYRQEAADTEQELAYMIDNHLAGLYEDPETGETYFLGYPYYPTDMSLMLTRFEPVGSVEATEFVFSDETPVAGQTVQVTAAIENTGLTEAAGCKIDFYEYRNNTRGRLLASVASNEPMPVNTAKKTVFDWTVPSDGPDGYCIQAVAREKKADGGYYDATENFSDAFVTSPEYELTLDQCVQNGDGFDVKYAVTNTGNAAAPSGTEAVLRLATLYGDMKERYGVDDDVLVSEDISDLAPGETRTVEKTVTIPVSVFRFCGYDAVTLELLDGDGVLIDNTDHHFITLDAPLNPALNGGAKLELDVGESEAAELTYDSTLFMDVNGKTVYSVADPAVAAVDENGVVMGLKKGVTTLTATLMPSGRTAETRVYVGGAGTKFVDVPEGEWFTDAVAWAAEQGITTGTDGIHFRPDAPCTRAQTVTFLWRAAGEPEPGVTQSPFTDVVSGSYYEKAVLWAAEQGITKGMDQTHFAPDRTVTRAQTVTFLYRFAKAKAAAGSVFDDVPADAWYAEAVTWAAENGITNGTGKTTFSPDASCKRSQIVTFLHRLLEDHRPKQAKKPSVFQLVK